MKKHILFASTFFVVIFSYAQTGPNLVCTTLSFGANEAGTIIRYIGGADSVSAEYNFPANPGNRGPLSSTLTEAFNNKLYGLSDVGGAFNQGILFEFNYITNTYIVKVNFDTLTIGGYLGSSLLLASNGLLYGTTHQGGSHNGGTIFSYSTGDTTVNKLLSMPARTFSLGPMIQASNGKLYGMTGNYGNDTSGTIFQYDINANSYTVLCNLPLDAEPEGSLIEVGTDTLYGLTIGDGINGEGTLFRYIIGATNDTVLVNFSTATGSNPSGSLIQATDGKLYGLTYNYGANPPIYPPPYAIGPGTLFNYDIGSGTFTDLHDFSYGTADGSRPGGDLYQASDGMLYGLTYSGGGGVNGLGTIFQYNINTRTYTKMVDLDSTTGAQPYWGHFIEYKTNTGIANIKGNNFSVYPNPTSSSFAIENNYPGTLSIQIINMLGEPLKAFNMTGAQQSFDISDLAAGIYEVEIGDGQQVLKVMKVVKE